MVFLVSDFISDDYQKAMQIANKRHDLVAITITDPREIELPNIGLVELEDAETGEIVMLDTADLTTRQTFTRQTSSSREERDRNLRSMNVDSIDIRTDVSYVEPLIKFFRMRAKRFR